MQSTASQFSRTSSLLLFLGRRQVLRFKLLCFNKHQSCRPINCSKSQRPSKMFNQLSNSIKDSLRMQHFLSKRCYRTRPQQRVIIKIRSCQPRPIIKRQITLSWACKLLRQLSKVLSPVMRYKLLRILLQTGLNKGICPSSLHKLFNPKTQPTSSYLVKIMVLLSSTRLKHTRATYKIHRTLSNKHKMEPINLISPLSTSSWVSSLQLTIASSLL